MVYVARCSSPLGEIEVTCNLQGILALSLEKDRYPVSFASEEIVEDQEFPILAAALTWLDDYFAGRQPSISRLSLAPAGGPFRQMVWNILCEIPYGELTTYGAIAKKVARLMSKSTMSSQAVGGAVGHNPIAIAIPCHRVVGSDGSLTGYGGGIANKVKLLTHEGVDMSRLYVPTKGTAL